MTDTQSTVPAETELAVSDEDRRFAESLAADFHLLADIFAADPQIAASMKYSVRTLVVPAGDKDGLVDLMRRLKSYGASVSKDITEKWFRAMCSFNVVTLDVFVAREEVCERVVVGTETIVSQVPDPELVAQVPLVEVTETQEVVEWRCHPLLADEPVPAEAVSA